MIEVKGQLIDKETRCRHYHSILDIVAIKFKCCDTYYPCYHCHEEDTPHIIERWNNDEFDEKAILCGHCQSEISIRDYMSTEHCPTCQALFNPRCSNHYSIYFDIKGEKNDNTCMS